MRRFLLVWLLCVFVPILRGGLSAAEPEASGIFGIAKLVVGDNSIRISKDSSIPYELGLIPGRGGSEVSAEGLTINIGDSFTISDRHHMSTTYRLIKTMGNTAQIEEARWTHFPAEKSSESIHTVLVRTYGIAVQADK